MKLTERCYISTLVRERQFDCAGERSFVSQRTLTVAVKKLEDEPGLSHS